RGVELARAFQRGFIALTRENCPQQRSKCSAGEAVATAVLLNAREGSRHQGFVGVATGRASHDEKIFDLLGGEGTFIAIAEPRKGCIKMRVKPSPLKLEDESVPVTVVARKKRFLCLSP